MADQDTTNISDLPIMQPPITNNKEEVLQNTTLSTQQHQLDNRVVAPQKQETLNQKPEKKKVTFKEPSKKAESFVLSLEHKIIILSTFFFFVFSMTSLIPASNPSTFYWSIVAMDNNKTKNAIRSVTVSA